MFHYMTPWVCVLFLFQIILNVFAFICSNQRKKLKSLSCVSFAFILSSSWNVSLNFSLTGPNAVEFIINHAEVSMAFVQDSKIPSVSSIVFLVHTSSIVSLDEILL